MSKVTIGGARDYSNRYQKVPNDPQADSPHANYPGGGKVNPNLRAGAFAKAGGYRRKGEKVSPGRGEQSGFARS